MGYKILFTLDLNNTSDTERTKFNDYLEEKNIYKLPNINTAWKVSFKSETSKIRAVDYTKNQIKNAAKYAGIKSYDAALQVGDTNIKEFNNK